MPEQPKPGQLLGIEPEETKIVSFTIRVDPPDSYVYSNVAGVSISPWDIRINFADVNVVNEGEQGFKAVIGIVMPPEHAAGLAMLLTRQLKQYEDQFGEIRHEPWQAMKARNAKLQTALAKEKSEQPDAKG